MHVYKLYLLSYLHVCLMCNYFCSLCVRVAETDCCKRAMQDSRPGIVRDAVTGKVQILDKFVNLRTLFLFYLWFESLAQILQSVIGSVMWNKTYLDTKPLFNFNNPTQSSWKLSSGELSVSFTVTLILPLILQLWHRLAFQLSKQDVWILTSGFAEKFVNPIIVYTTFSHPFVTQLRHRISASLLYMQDLTSMLNDIVQCSIISYGLLNFQ